MEEHESIRRETALRCAREPMVFAVQASMEVRCRSMEYFEDFDILGIGMQTREVPVQFGLALDAAGRSLGTYDLHAGVRSATRKGVRQVSGLDRVSELADACPRTRVIWLCECKFREFVESTLKLEGTSIIRAGIAEKHRVLRADGGSEGLFVYMERQPVLAEMDLDIGSGAWPSKRIWRPANLELRAARIVLEPPKSGPRTPREFTAVYAKETKGKRPLRWMLISNESQADAQTAKNVVEWYGMRGRVEEFSTVLKNGFRGESHWPETVDDLRITISQAVDVASEVYNRQRLLMESPERPAIEAFNEGEILVVHALSLRASKKTEPDMNQSIKSFIIDMASLVGFYPSKNQGLPGTEKVWEGWKRLKTGVWVVEVMNKN